MRSRLFSFSIGVVLSAAAVSCTASGNDPDVVFGSGQPIGRWQTPAAGSSPAAAGSQEAGRTSSGVAGSSPDISVNSGTLGSGTLSGSAGAIATAAVGGSQGAATNTSSGSAGTLSQAGRGGAPAAGSGGSNANDPATATVASVSFDVTTSAVGYRYQPKNIGAIWVQDASGKLVKSLEVWAGLRRRYLTRYASALSGGSVDVTASATLSNHRTHHATWNLKDRTGALVPSGKYTLVMELTDGDQSGRFNTVEFDTKAGVVSMSPTDAPSFSAMKLQLQ